MAETSTDWKKKPVAAGCCRLPPGSRGSARAGVTAGVMIAALMLDAGRELRAEAPKGAIAGLGATTCGQFNADVKLNPGVRKDYLAWAQGYMSGIRVGRPPGVDEGLDLNPPTFALINQLQFLEDHCARNESADFADAVEALYKRLRMEGKA
jgi:hypothetical protein